MLNPDQKEAAASAVKLGSAWASVKLGDFLASMGFTSWGDVASFFAAVYTFCLVVYFLWRKVLRPLCLHFRGRGVVK